MKSYQQATSRSSLSTSKEHAMRSLRLLPLLLLSLLATGCATVFHGTRQNIRVETDPPRATASAKGQTITTPGVLKLHRKETNLEVVIEKEGYVPRRVKLTRKASGANWANTLFLPVGVVAGAGIGASISRDPDAFENALTGAVAGGLLLPAAVTSIDLATGAAYKLDPSRIVVRLKPLAPRESVPVDGTRGEPPADRESSQPTTNPKEIPSSLSYDRPR
jgi:hypothetical protein